MLFTDRPTDDQDIHCVLIKCAAELLQLNSSIANRFGKFFHSWKHTWIFYEINITFLVRSLKKLVALPCVKKFKHVAMLYQSLMTTHTNIHVQYYMYRLAALTVTWWYSDYKPCAVNATLHAVTAPSGWLAPRCCPTRAVHALPIPIDTYRTICQCISNKLHQCVPKKWRQNRNHNNCNKSYQN